MENFYTPEEQEQVRSAIAEPLNGYRAMSEATGLRILDGIYMLIKLLLRKDKPDEAE